MKKIIGVIAFSLCLQNISHAQLGRGLDGSLGTRVFDGIFTKYDGNRDGKNGSGDDDRQNAPISKNIFKINLASLAFNNYSAQYERIITEKLTFALGARFMPETPLPLSANFKDQLSQVDTAFSSTFSNSTLSNFAITPEIRFYLSNNVGKGFYVAPFLRYEDWTLKVPFNTKLQSGKPLNISLTGNKTVIGGGMMLGTQFSIGKRIVLDWWIGGVYGGSNKIQISAESNTWALTSSEITQIQDIFDVSNGVFDLKSDITANKITITSDGGISYRSGLCLGFRF
ncbi:MAG: hypothetical protein RLZZ118_2153 [Bacteroidota bacterium]|jgi:hypothetical protein|nr:DUF3575 domain-containing protein [Chitinophagaceae bacterium]